MTAPIDVTPVVVIVPGFLRTASDLPAFAALLEPRFEVVFWKLPAHASPHLSRTGVAPSARRSAPICRRPSATARSCSSASRWAVWRP
jgi:hypothetical protein